MPHLVLRLLRLAVVALALGAAPAVAQAPAPAPAAQAQKSAQPDAVGLIDRAKGVLDQVLAALKRDSLDDGSLQGLRSQLDPAAANVQKAIDTLTPTLDAAKARLEQLGPKPADDAPPESASVTADRAEQQKHFNDIDEALKRARLLGLQIEQTGSTIVSRRRALFVSSLFQRSYSIVSPTLWQAVADEVGVNARAIRFVAGDFVSSMLARLEGWRLPGYLGIVALIALLNIPLYRIVQRILSRETTDAQPTRLAKALGACWVAIVASVAPIATVIVLFALSDAFGLDHARLAPLKRAIVDSAVRVALMMGLARGLLAPSRPNWRLFSMSTPTAERLSHLAFVVAVIVSVVKIVDSFNEIIGASLPVTAATQGIGALIFAAVVAGGLFGLGAAEDEDDECLGPRIEAAPRWAGIVRVGAWLVLAVTCGAVLTGFIPFSNFLIDQFLWVAIVIAVMCILIPLVTESLEQAFQPQTRLGRTLVGAFGVRREGVAQAGIVLSGLAQVFLLGLCALLLIAPWGVQSDDVAGGVRNAFFGFKVGEVTVSPSSIIVALLLFAAGYTATRAVQGWFDQRLMPATNLDAGLRNSIRTSVGYVGYILAASLALAHVGLGFDKIAIVAGALSVGIGFGLNSIFNNFVSGIIVLWERAVRVGDLVVIGDEQGFVRKINVRATEIETFDRATMIVPNSNLITGVVKNWVRNDRVSRIKIPVAINTGVDPEAVREIMTGAAKDHEQVAKIPAPVTLFVAMEPAALKFELICFVDDVETAGRVKSDLHYEIFRKFRENDIALGSPSSVQVTLQGSAADAVEQLARGGAAADAAK